MQISSFVSDSYIINLCLGYQLCLICPLILLYFLTLLHRNPGIFSPYVWTLPSKSYLPFCLKQEYSYLCGQGGDVTIIIIIIVTAPFHESRLNWIHDPAPPPSRCLESTDTVPRSDSSVNSSVTIPRNTLAPIPSDSLHNSSVSDSSVPHPNNSYPKHVPKHKKSENEVSSIAMRGSSAAPLSPAPPKKRRIRRRRQARRAANRNSGDVAAAPLTPDAGWANQRAAGPAGATQTQPENSDPTSTRRTAVYPPSRIVGDSSANENSPFQLGLESSRIPGLYKLAVPDQQQDTPARTFRVKNSGSGTS